MMRVEAMTHEIVDGRKLCPDLVFFVFTFGFACLTLIWHIVVIKVVIVEFMMDVAADSPLRLA